MIINEPFPYQTSVRADETLLANVEIPEFQSHVAVTALHLTTWKPAESDCVAENENPLLDESIELNNPDLFPTS